MTGKGTGALLHHCGLSVSRCRLGYQPDGYPLTCFSSRTTGTWKLNFGCRLCEWGWGSLAGGRGELPSGKGSASSPRLVPLPGRGGVPGLLQRVTGALFPGQAVRNSSSAMAS